MLARRTFLKSGTASLLLAGLGPILLTGRRASASQSVPSYDEFAPQVDRWFQLRGESTHHLQLIEVEDRPVDPRLGQFTLVFRGPANDPVAAGLYDVTSRESAHTFFVQPAGGDAAGEYYLVHCSLIRPLSASCAGSA